MSEALTNKLLHPPTQALNAATDIDREELIRMAERLYQIPKE
jgi:glutamyl-tRNA reductase